MTRLFMACVGLCLLVAPSLTAADPRAKPVLEVKVYTLAKAEPGEVSNALTTLLGEPDVVIEKAKPPKKNDLGGGSGDITAPLWRMAADENSRTVVVRGTPGHLAIADDVVAVLDRKDDAAMPATKTIKAFVLKHANSGEVSNLLTALEFDDLQIAAGGEKVIMVAAPEATAKAVAAIVKAMDVQSKSGP